jgi:hypothetical protein
VTPARFEASVQATLRSPASDDRKAALIAADAHELGAWWIERALRGDRFTVAGRAVYLAALDDREEA